MAHHWTWQKLAQNAYRMNPKSRGQNYPYVPKWETQIFTGGQNRGQKVIVPYKGTNSLLISLRAWGVTQASLHSVTLLFSDVDIQTENPNDTSYFQVQYDNTMYWCKKLDRTRNPLTSRCTCASFFYDFAFYNYRAGCLYGKQPKPYIRKTTWAKPRNPHGIIACCKHIYHAWSYLKNSGLTVN